MQRLNYLVYIITFIIILIAGEHTRTIYVGNPTKTNSVFSKFVTIKQTCFNCKSVIDSGVVCKNCIDKLKSIYIERRLELNYAERIYAGILLLLYTFIDLWTQCQRCQGFVMQEIICQNKDCPIFYKRIKIKKDLSDIQNKFQRFKEQIDW